eukprot:TRINITY_DN83642_c0_g1_i1.p1 TRINITY_DN83642_c0_g1~~TRINITY_DN83642_c0_g1_i1.p1  ORF type:complete len:229 (+),score=56.34 TRINITY_DN83642_c0_g1_i1:123-809(+)
MAGLTQLELDELCCSDGERSDVEQQAPASPQDTCLRKRRRRVTLSAMSAEIAALAEDDDTTTTTTNNTGLSQNELDTLSAPAPDHEPGTRDRSSSPISSGLQRAKRSRLSVSHGKAGAAASAAKTLGFSLANTPEKKPSSGGGYSQAELDAIACPTAGRQECESRSPVRSQRRRNRLAANENSPLALETDENKVSPGKDGSHLLNLPSSPCRSKTRPLAAPLSPVKLN